MTASPSDTVTTADTPPDLEDLARQVDEALAALESLESEARARAEAVKAAIEAFHKSGLTTIVKRLKGDPRGKELLFELVEDAAVRALLTLHGIVRSEPLAAVPPEPMQPLELVQIQLPVVVGAEPS